MTMIAHCKKREKIYTRLFFFPLSSSFGNPYFCSVGRWMSSSKRVWSEPDKTERSFSRACLSKSFCEKRELLHAGNPCRLVSQSCTDDFCFEVAIIGCQTKSWNWLNEGPVVESLSRIVFACRTKSRLNCFHFYHSTPASCSCRHVAGKKSLFMIYIFYYTVKYLVSILMP